MQRLERAAVHNVNSDGHKAIAGILRPAQAAIEPDYAISAIGAVDVPCSATRNDCHLFISRCRRDIERSLEVIKKDLLFFLAR